MFINYLSVVALKFAKNSWVREPFERLGLLFPVNSKWSRKGGFLCGMPLRLLSRTSFDTTSLFSGGLVLMIAGGLFAYFTRDSCLGGWRCGSLAGIDVLDNEQAFDWLEAQRGLQEHSYSRDRARSLAVKTVPVDYAHSRSNLREWMNVHGFLHRHRGAIILSGRSHLVGLYRERPSVKRQVAVQGKCAVISDYDLYWDHG
ncbi:MAG: hypothetical protein U0894_08100 [Pirellulales bacterium]